MSFDTDRRVEELAGTSTTVRMNNFRTICIMNGWHKNKTTVYFNHCNTISL